MKIIYDPMHAIPSVTHVKSKCLEKLYKGISEWKYRECKVIPDDLTFREKIQGVSQYVKLVDELLSDSNFRPYGKPNPRFTCQQCGVNTGEFTIKDSKMIPLENHTGQRLCLQCYNKKD